jgi:hypothetical protein
VGQISNLSRDAKGGAMNLFDQVVLLATGLVAVFLIWRLFQHFQNTNQPMYDVYYIGAFAVLFVAGVLLIVLSYNVLASPLVVIVAALIPAGLSLGLVSEFNSKNERAYLIFLVVGLLALAITRLAMPGMIATIVLIIVHTVAGLIIFGLPILVTQQKKAPQGFVFVTIGGALIGIGGLALAALKIGAPILPAEFIFLILAPLLLLMTLSFTYGFIAKIKA